MAMTEIPVVEVDEARFRECMKELREDRGWSQGELSRQLMASGWAIFHQTTISRIESGERPVKLGEARAIAAILESTVDAMVAPSEETKLARDFWNSFAAWRETSVLLQSSAHTYLRARKSLLRMLDGPNVGNDVLNDGAWRELRREVEASDPAKVLRGITAEDPASPPESA